MKTSQPHTRIIVALLAPLGAAPALAQDPLDRSDPAIVEQELPRPMPKPDDPAEPRIAPPPAAQAGPRTGVFVGAVRVENAELIAPKRFAPAIAPYIGRQLDSATLQWLAGDVARVAREAGYLFATAAIPPQTLSSGVLRVELDLGRIAEVRVVGTDNPAVKRMLRPLGDGTPPTRAVVERQLLLAADIPGIRLRRTRYVREQGRGVLIVHVAEDRAEGALLIDNRGSEAIGPVRARARADLRGIVSAGDELTLEAIATPLQPREFVLFAADYTMLLGSRGLDLTFAGAHGRSRPGARLRRFDTQGRSIDTSLALSYPLVRSRAISLWASGEFGFRRSVQDQRTVRVREDRLTTLAATVNGFAPFAGGRVRARVSIVQGLDLFDATRATDRLASRRDGDARFTRAELWSDWTRPLGRSFSARIALAGQLASRPLLASEEIGLGGPRFGRGYDYSERSGDEGVLGSAELRFDVMHPPLKLLTELQVYGYGDGGTVWNLRSGRNGGSLASAGGGIRAELADLFDVGIELGLPINADRFDSGDRSPRVSFSIGTDF